MKEIFAQLDRAEELLMELEASSDSDKLQPDVSFRTRILTQEVLVKMRYILDQTMYSFYEKKIRQTLTADERKHVDRHLYFPIVFRKNCLDQRLKDVKMIALKIKYPKLYCHLNSVQPYNRGYEWMADFRDISNERHVRLSRQDRKEQKYLTFEHKGEKHILWATAEVGTVGLSVGDRKIHPNQLLSPDSEHIKADPEIKIKKKKSVVFVFSGTQIDAIGLCQIAVIQGKTIVSQFLSLY